MTRRHATLRRALWVGGALGALALGVVVVASRALVELHPASAQGTRSQEVRFLALDLSVDSGSRPLAAWQIEVRLEAPSGTATEIVGVEGGEHVAFRDAPYYDPAALSRAGRIILAAFHTGTELPTGPTRVARLHVLVEGSGEPRWKTLAPIATDRGVRDIPVTVSLVETPAVPTPDEKR